MKDLLISNGTIPHLLKGGALRNAGFRYDTAARQWLKEDAVLRGETRHHFLAVVNNGIREVMESTGAPINPDEVLRQLGITQGNGFMLDEIAAANPENSSLAESGGHLIDKPSALVHA